MRPFTSTISLDEARRRLAANVRPIERTERVPLARAAGRVAAADVIVGDRRAAILALGDGRLRRRSPPTPRGATPQRPVRLRIVDRIYTGQTADGHAIDPGTCAEIATGAPLPDGADAVVMVEETARGRRRPGAIIDAAAPRARTSAGAAPTSRPATSSCGAAICSTRAASARSPPIGCADVEVFARPRVADSVDRQRSDRPGTPLAPGQIYDVNRFTLGAVVAAHGGVAEPHRAGAGHARRADRGARRCAGADVIVFSGGSSVGERDLIVDLVAARGEMIFHGIAVKPGKPTAFALVGRRPFFGMPGNPTSCLSNAYILLVPFLRATARLPLLRAADRPRAARPHGSSRRPAATSSTRCACRTAPPSRPSKDPATSPASRRPTATSRFPPTRATIEAGRSCDVTLF